MVLSLQYVNVVDVEIVPGPKNSENNRQPDNHFRRGNGHDNEGEYLSIQRFQKTGIANQQKIHGVQHELHGH
jgi:hypothetical protein